MLKFRATLINTGIFSGNSMISNEHSGIFIVIDGIDGAGKTTQVNLLAKQLQYAGETVVVSKEPTNGVWGKKIRETATTGRLPVAEELEAFLKDREEHIHTKILPNLEKGSVVIVDRYFYSTIAYQGIREIEDLQQLEVEVKQNALKPDAVFIIDIDPRIAAIRITDRDGQPNEFEKLEDQIKIREIFGMLCNEDLSINVIDGNKTINDVNKDVATITVNGILKQKRCYKDYGCDDQLNCGYRMTNTCIWSNMKDKILSAIKQA